MKEKNNSDPYKELSRHLICEPVTRRDGVRVEITKIENNRGTGYIVVSAYAASAYTVDEIVLLGDGNFMHGVLRLGQATFSAPSTSLYAGSTRLLNDEINSLKSSESFPQ